MLINVIDLEASCWSSRRPPEGQRSEIIEIGLCTLDTVTLELQRAPRMLIRPEDSEISDFCTQLTGIRPADVAHAPLLREVLDALEASHHLSTRAWMSWGNYDRRMLGEEAARVGRGVSARHTNLKAEHARVRGRKPSGLGQACQSEDLSFDGRAHQGDDDAWNVARIAAHLIGAGVWRPD